MDNNQENTLSIDMNTPNTEFTPEMIAKYKQSLQQQSSTMNSGFVSETFNSLIKNPQAVVENLLENKGVTSSKIIEETKTPLQKEAEAMMNNRTQMTIMPADTTIITTPISNPSVPTPKSAQIIQMPISNNQEASLPKTEQVATMSKALDSIKVDIKELNIVKPNVKPGELKKLIQKNLGLLKASKKVYQVICFQSGYKAEMSALGAKEIQDLLSDDLDTYSYQKKYYQLVFSHVEDTSVGKLDFDTWMKITSLFDLETLLFGIYCTTFPYNNKFTITCNSDICKNSKPQKTFDYGVNNNNLVSYRDEDLPDLMIKRDELIKSKNSDHLLLNSHLNTSKRVFLEESKFIVDIKIPSLFYQLEEAIKITNDGSRETNEIGLALMFTDAFYIPYLDTDDEVKYLPVTSTEEKLQILNDMNYLDSKDFTEQISDFINKYRISYKIKKPLCPHCRIPMDDIDVRLQELIFLAIRLGKSGKLETTDTMTI